MVVSESAAEFFNWLEETPFGSTLAAVIRANPTRIDIDTLSSFKSGQPLTERLFCAIAYPALGQSFNRKRDDFFVTSNSIKPGCGFGSLYFINSVVTKLFQYVPFNNKEDGSWGLLALSMEGEDEDYWLSPLRQPLPLGLGNFFKETINRTDEDIVVDNDRMGSYCGDPAESGFMMIMFLEKVLNRNGMKDIGEYGAVDKVSRMIRERYLAMILASYRLDVGSAPLNDFQQFIAFFDEINSCKSSATTTPYPLVSLLSPATLLDAADDEDYDSDSSSDSSSDGSFFDESFSDSESDHEPTSQELHTSYIDGVIQARTIIDERYGMESDWLYFKDLEYRCGVKLRSPKAIQSSVLRLLNFRNSVLNLPSFVLSDLEENGDNNVGRMEFLNRIENVNELEKIGLVAGDDYKDKWKAIGFIARTPLNPSNMERAMDANLVTKLAELDKERVVKMMSRKAPSTSSIKSSSCLSVYIRRILVNALDCQLALESFLESRPQYAYRIEMILEEIDHLIERTPSEFQETLTVALPYTGITAFTPMQRLHQSLSLCSTTAESYTGDEPDTSLFERFLSHLVLGNVDFSLDLYRIGNSVPYDSETLRDLNGNTMNMKDIDESLTFARLVMKPEIDLAERFFIRLHGFFSLNVSGGGSIHPMPCEPEILNLLRSTLDRELTAYLSTLASSSNFSTNTTISQDTVDKLGQILTTYISILNRLPAKLVGPPISSQLQDTIRAQLMDQPVETFRDGSVLAFLFEKDITEADFKRGCGFYDFSAGQGPFLYTCANDLLRQLTPPTLRRQNEHLPFADLWFVLKHRLLVPTLYLWVSPILSTLRPLVLRTHGANVLFVISNFLANVDRGIVGTKSIPRASLLSDEIGDNPEWRFDRHFAKGFEFERMLRFESDGTSVLSDEEIRNRRQEFYEELYQHADDIHEDSFGNYYKEWSKKIDVNYNFVNEHVGVPRVVGFTMDTNNDCGIVIPNMHPGKIKYNSITAQLATKIHVVTEAISIVVESTVKRVWDTLPATESRRARLEKILADLKMQAFYLKLEEKLDELKDEFRIIDCAYKFLATNAKTKTGELNLIQPPRTPGRRNIIAVGGKDSELRHRHYLDIAFEMTETGYIGLGRAIDPYARVPANYRDELGTRLPRSPFMDFFMSKVVQGAMVSYSASNFLNDLEFAEVAGWCFKKMRQFVTIKQLKTNRLKTVEDMKGLTEEDIQWYMRPKIKSLEKGKKRRRREKKRREREAKRLAIDVGK